MPRKLKFYVRKNEQRLQSKSVSVLVPSHKEVAVQTEPMAEPDMADAEVQTDSPDWVTEDIAQIDLQPVDRVDIETQTDMEVMAPNEVCATDVYTVEAYDDEATSDGLVCEGNNDEKFGPLVAKHKGIFRNVKGTY